MLSSTSINTILCVLIYFVQCRVCLVHTMLYESPTMPTRLTTRHDMVIETTDLQRRRLFHHFFVSHFRATVCAALPCLRAQGHVLEPVHVFEIGLAVERAKPICTITERGEGREEEALAVCAVRLSLAPFGYSRINVSGSSSRDSLCSLLS